MTLILSNAEIAEIVNMDDCISALEEAFIGLAQGRGAFRRRSDICTPTNYAGGGMYVLKSMDGVIPELGVGAIRINSDIVTFPEINGSQRKVKVPAAPDQRYTGLILLFSTTTGEPLAIFPDGVIQPMRVGATSALGAKCLARENSKIVAILGSGGQARSQVRAIVCVHPVKEIRCYSPRKENRDLFAKEMSPVVGIAIKPTETAEAAVSGADIVLGATNSMAPVFKPEWIEKGMHLSAIQPNELGSEVMCKADVAATLMEDCDPIYIKKVTAFMFRTSPRASFPILPRRLDASGSLRSLSCSSTGRTDEIPAEDGLRAIRSHAFSTRWELARNLLRSAPWSIAVRWNRRAATIFRPNGSPKRKFHRRDGEACRLMDWRQTCAANRLPAQEYRLLSW